MDHPIGEWVWSTQHGEVGQVVDVEDLWGVRTLRLWLPAREATVCVGASAVTAVGDCRAPSEHQLVFVAAAARIADALATDQLLAPLESNVIPLPHQLHALSRA
ncbi:MAG TPA: hypothetical protein P5307_12275, partial [Pirellulaceae bacterium]|nr:hypothetical protein [Pirellulaceae bacterium]